MKTVRRGLIKNLFTAFAGFTGSGVADAADKIMEPENKISEVTGYQDIPMFSGYTRLGNLVFVSGRGDRLDGDIKVHTDNVLKVIEGELRKAGSSMEKVLKVNVYLNDMNDFQGMNEVYNGRFGKDPPVRTTIAVPGGLPPADAYIQMDCIAYV